MSAVGNSQRGVREHWRRAGEMMESCENTRGGGTRGAISVTEACRSMRFTKVNLTLPEDGGRSAAAPESGGVEFHDNRWEDGAMIGANAPRYRPFNMVNRSASKVRGRCRPHASRARNGK